jgi:hypothetical protein
VILSLQQPGPSERQRLVVTDPGKNGKNQKRMVIKTSGRLNMALHRREKTEERIEVVRKYIILETISSIQLQ